MDDMVAMNDLKQHEQKEMIMLNKLMEKRMDTPMVENIIKGMPMGNGYGGDGMGFGGGGLGLVALLALLSGNRNGGGLFGGNGGIDAGGGAVNQITLGQIQGTLGDIKASVPLAEAQVQLALAGQAASITSQITGSTQELLRGEADIRRDVANSNAVTIAAISNVERAVNAGTYATATTVRDDGDKTRALITAQNEANLQRMLTVAENALAEQRAVGRSREIEVNVTQNQNQLQTQAQAQQQQQYTNALLQQILCQAQVAQATNQSLIIGNTGGVLSGPQTANPVNVRA